jgi:hypothetical protein
MRCRPGFLVALALALYAWMAVSVSPRMGVTADEVVHLTGGYSYWKYNDYRLHPENGTLPMRLAALPLLALPLQFPPLDTPDWLTSKVDRVGRTFFFGLGNPVDRMLARARLMVALVGAFAVWLTWRWARGLFGPAAGWIALALAVFSPTLLAHGGLATSDLALTACLLAALSIVWRLLHRVTWPRLALAILVCGATFLAKMSGVLLVPLIALLLFARWLRPAPFVLALGRPRWLRRRAAVAAATLGLTGAVAAGSLVVLWAGYGFRYAADNPAVSGRDGLYLSWETILDRAPLPSTTPTALARFSWPRPVPRPTAMTRLIGVLRDHRLLPEAYLWGFAHTYKFSRERPAFLHGDYSLTGWRLFFPTAFLLKTTLPTLVLLAAGALTLIALARAPAGTGRPRWLYRAAPLAFLTGVYGVFAITTHLNIGHRHILPLYPIVFVTASATALWLRGRPRWLTWALGGVLALHAADSLAARPFYLSYFQPLAGGPDRGYRWLVDSSFDWGQGLPDLADWLAAKKARGDATPVYLTYFGADSPRARALDVVRFGDAINDAGLRVYPAKIGDGWFAISATHFQRVYLPVRGPWTPGLEALYRELMRRLGSTAAYPESDVTARTRLLADAEDYELLMFGRLCHYLRDRTPDRVIGGSILLFRLTDAEVDFALHAPWNAFQPYLR